MPRTVIGGFKSGIQIETERLARKGKGFWCLENELLQGWAMTAGLFTATTALFGKRSIPFMVGQAAYGASLLEVINYVEHYGLKREKLANGKYERTAPTHSWNSNHIVTNLVLYQLQRHSDHHANPSRSFQALRHFENAPQLSKINMDPDERNAVIAKYAKVAQNIQARQEEVKAIEQQEAAQAA